MNVMVIGVLLLSCATASPVDATAGVPAQMRAGTVLVYDENDGVISNIYYVDSKDPSGYSIHGEDGF